MNLMLQHGFFVSSLKASDQAITCISEKAVRMHLILEIIITKKVASLR